MPHRWNKVNRCSKCGARREPLPPGVSSRPGDVSPFRYFLPDSPGEYGKRPACTMKGEARRSRRAGRRARSLAASRAGSPRRLSREAVACLARRGATATAGPGPSGTGEPSNAS